MQLEYAVERLYSAGWVPNAGDASETLPDGRQFPSPQVIRAEFGRAGLALEIKHNPKFCCYRATWAPAGHRVDPDAKADERHGTVVGACEREAAVYALAQMLVARGAMAGV